MICRCSKSLHFDIAVVIVCKNHSRMHMHIQILHSLQVLCGPIMLFFLGPGSVQRQIAKGFDYYMHAHFQWETRQFMLSLDSTRFVSYFMRSPAQMVAFLEPDLQLLDSSIRSTLAN